MTSLKKLSTNYGLHRCNVIEGNIGDSFLRCVAINDARDEYNWYHQTNIGEHECVRDYVAGIHPPHYPVPATEDVGETFHRHYWHMTTVPWDGTSGYCECDPSCCTYPNC